MSGTDLLALRSGLLMVLAAALMPTALGAQASGSTETGSLRTIAPAGGYGTRSKDVRAIVRKFAACSIGRKRGLVERYLAAQVGSADYARLQNEVFEDDCMGAGELRFSHEVIRGALFDVLYSLDFGRAPPADFSALPPIDYMKGYTPPLDPEAGSAIAFAQFGDCVARADAPDVRLLLLSLPDSERETAMIAALSPRLGPCVPQGQSIRFSKSVLRGALAEGMYRLSRAASGRPWGGAA